MSKAKYSFTRMEIARALRAAREAGTPPTSVELDHKTGLVTIRLNGGASVAVNDRNEWDDGAAEA